MRFGVFITPSADDPRVPVDVAVAADRAGLDLVTFQDHPYQPRFLDTWTLLSYVAARTEHVQLAGNVHCLPLRPPAVLARSVASLDRLSGGRMALGLGTGAFWDAIAAMGGPRRSPGEAVSALAEALVVIRDLWDTEARGGARFNGVHYWLAGAKRGPAPAHPIPIWLGAYKPRMLALVGREANGWLPSMSYLPDVAALDEGHARIDDAAYAAGRDPNDIERLLNIDFDLAEPSRLIDLASEHRVRTVIVALDSADQAYRLGQEIAPATRAALE